ncbi:MAG: hypothetical protein LBG61_04950 [Burkholderiales bacterium]|jgi:uncharacterized membrane protein|nr:hypothetical protein [Burkholderiales bacterium]
MNANIVVIVISVLYPFAVWIGTRQLSPRWVSLFLLAVLLTRILSFKKSKMMFLAVAGGLILAAVALFTNAALPLKLYPVVMNATLFLVFAASLVYPPTVIERIARLKEPELPSSAVFYTRRVTQVWCVFFIVNGAIAFYTSLYTSDAVWSLYNGLIAYFLIGLLLAIEYCVRIRFKRRHDADLSSP